MANLNYITFNGIKTHLDFKFQEKMLKIMENKIY